METATLEIQDDADGKPLLCLPPVVDLTAVKELKSALQTALSRGAGLGIDASAVERVTTPCLQVLATGRMDFARAGGPAMVFTQASQPFARAVTTLALGSVLPMPETPHE